MLVVIIKRCQCCIAHGCANFRHALLNIFGMWSTAEVLTYVFTIQVKDNLQEKKVQVIDARGKAR